MTNYIILALCLLILLAYTFDITSRYTRIPGVLLLIALGIGIQLISRITGLSLPDLKPILPVLGTLGLILIVLEASLDLRLEKSKIKLIMRSVFSAVILLVVFTASITLVLVKLMGLAFLPAVLNAIPLGIISSAVAIPSAMNLNSSDREFIVYESAISDIAGILAFDFILVYNDSLGPGLFYFTLNGLLTVVVALVVAAILGVLLHKITYHVNYVIILTFIVLAYTLAKLVHLPALLLIIIFGLVISNNRFFEIPVVESYVNFEKFRNDVVAFRKILGELTFLVRSFFFIIFGYNATLSGFLSFSNLITSMVIIASGLFLRWVFLSLLLRIPAVPLVFFSPRGLITILLFLSIPMVHRTGIITEEVIIMVILFSVVILAVGNLFNKVSTGEIISQSENADRSVSINSFPSETGINKGDSKPVQ